MVRALIGDMLLGDRLMTTPAIRKLKEVYPEDNIYIKIPKKDKNPQVSVSEPLLRNNPYITYTQIGDVDWGGGIKLGPVSPVPQDFVIDETLPPIDTKMEEIDMDSMAAYLWAVKNNKTIAQGFGNLCGVEIGDDDLRYDYFSTPEEEEKGKQLVQDLGKGKPVVAVFRHSASCSSNDPKIGWANKCLANFIWVGVAQWLQSEGYVPVALGGEKELKDVRYRQWAGEKLYGENIRTVAAFLKYCKATLAVDTGGRHLAAAVGCNMMCISGTINLAQIRCQPVKEDQKIFEVYEPLQNVSIPYVIDKAKKVL